MSSASAALAATTLGTFLRADTSVSATQPEARRKKDKGPPIAPELVREFVGAGHGKLDRVREMLIERPAVVNCVWDWGGGDFESALGGASHMGRPDIASYLIEHGARLDIFAAAMLGKLEIVEAACVAFPNTPQVPGPHGITLLEHARKGGDPARSVVDYLLLRGC